VKITSEERQQYGRMGAIALNSDPEKKAAAAKKAAATRLAKNPNIFREMGSKGGGSNKKIEGQQS
jgi:general stress protein YciG